MEGRGGSILSLVVEHDAIDTLNAVCSACSLSELGRLACTSRFFEAALLTRSNHVWDTLCSLTWADKVHIAESAVALRSSPNGARSALRCSLADAKRTSLTDEEYVHCGLKHDPGRCLSAPIKLSRSTGAFADRLPTLSD